MSARMTRFRTVHSAVTATVQNVLVLFGGLVGNMEISSACFLRVCNL